MELRHSAGNIQPRALERKLKSLLQAGVTHIPRRRTGTDGRFVAAVASTSLSALGAANATPIAAQCHAAELSVAQELLEADASTSPQEMAAARTAALNALAQKVAACRRCVELARTRTQTVFGVGNPLARLVFMGEAPGADEDLKGEPFVGRAGQLLTDIITKGMKIRREDVYILNTIKCRPPGNRTPSPEEAANCREFLDGQLAILKPEFICCLGAVASQNLLGTTVPIGQLRGRFHDFRGIKVLCTYHPAYVLRYPASKRQVWDDIQMLMRAMGLMK